MHLGSVPIEKEVSRIEHNRTREGERDRRWDAGNRTHEALAASRHMRRCLWGKRSGQFVLQY